MFYVKILLLLMDSLYILPKLIYYVYVSRGSTNFPTYSLNFYILEVQQIGGRV